MTNTARGESTALLRRLLDAERDASQERERANRLVALQTAFAHIARAQSVDEIKAVLLRAARSVLGYDRAVTFRVDRFATVIAEVQVDGGDTIEPADVTPIVVPTGAFARAIGGSTDLAFGSANELDPPIIDVRVRYAIVALRTDDGPLHLLYVDDPTFDAGGENDEHALATLGSIASIAIENILRAARTAELAARDSLTGLYNRRAFSELLLAEIATSQRSGRPFAYVMLDVDNFKSINDTYGHARGDAVLKDLARILQRTSRVGDIVGRYAGDEFVIVHAGVDRDLAQNLLERLVRELNESNISCSIGAAIFPHDAGDAGKLLAAADTALYRTKARGKNGFAFYSD